MDKLQKFVIWLDGYLEAIGDDININKTNVIKNKLNDLFEHEAEKLSQPNQSLTELGEKHGFNVYDGLPDYNNPPFNGMIGDDKTLYRC
jgi:hypothetical protein